MMKLTKPETIQENEKEFIDAINAELDWHTIEKMLFEKHNLTLQEEIDYKHGDLVVYKNQIAYKFDFEIKVPLSLIFDREGECLEITTVRNGFEKDPADALPKENSTARDQEDKVSRMALNIADMISEINDTD